MKKKTVRLEDELTAQVEAQLDGTGISFNALVVDLLEHWLNPAKFTMAESSMTAPVEVKTAPSIISEAPQVAVVDNTEVLAQLEVLKGKMDKLMGGFQQGVINGNHAYDQWKQSQAPVQSPAPNPATSTKEETGFERWQVPADKGKEIVDNFVPYNNPDDFTRNEEGKTIVIDTMEDYYKQFEKDTNFGN